MGNLNTGELLRDLGLNVVAVLILVYPIYYRRHRRWEQVVGYVAFNVSLFTVAAALGSSAPLNVGVGFGLFAVLSIIRLRSEEGSQVDIGYTMVALVLGLMTGLPGMQFGIKLIFSSLLVGTMFLIDNHLLSKTNRYRKLRIELDRIIYDEDELVGHLTALLNRSILEAEVREIDCVRETMRLDVHTGPPRR